MTERIIPIHVLDKTFKISFDGVSSCSVLSFMLVLIEIRNSNRDTAFPFYQAVSFVPALLIISLFRLVAVPPLAEVLAPRRESGALECCRKLVC